MSTPAKPPMAKATSVQKANATPRRSKVEAASELV
jgi:hypothetical protein